MYTIKSIFSQKILTLIKVSSLVAIASMVLTVFFEIEAAGLVFFGYFILFFFLIPLHVYINVSDKSIFHLLIVIASTSLSYIIVPPG